MNRLVALVMVLTLAAICAEIVQGENPWWIGWVSIALAGKRLCADHDPHGSERGPARRGNDSPSSNRRWRAQSS